MVEEEEAMVEEEASVDLEEGTVDLVVAVALAGEEDMAVFTLVVHTADMVSGAMYTPEVVLDLEVLSFRGQFIGITTTITELRYLTYEVFNHTRDFVST
jgi:hypothetical protein